MTAALRLPTAVLAAAAALAGAAPAFACSVRASPDPRIPTFAAVTGVTLGQRTATPAEIDRYLLAVDRATPRVRTFLAGRSRQGRPIRYAAVGTPGHVRPGRLERLGALMRAVRAGRRGPASVEHIARTRPAFVWIGGSVHGNERSGGDADMALLYELAAGRTCRASLLRRRLVVFLLPVQNPDGRAAGARLNHANFDLNRDWFARTQPESRARISALVRYPPTIFADQHEQGGDGFFFPPNADPIHHEISHQALRAIDDIVAPRLQAAFRARGLAFTNYATYDLFFMGYGDTVPTTLFGAAGMTFEKGGDAPLAARVAGHLLAARETVRAAALRRRTLLAKWGAQWAQAAAQGRRGTLQANRVVQPGNSVRFPVPDERVYGYILLTDRHGADAAALAQRLVSVGVRVRRLLTSVPASALRGFGETAAAATSLPTGTLYVPSAQAQKHWVEALLGPDPYVPFPYFYDVSSWSNPLLMGLAGGTLLAPLTVPRAAAVDVTAHDAAAAPPAGPGGYGFDGGSEGSAELAFDLLRDGLGVTRTDTGGFVVASGDAGVAAAAARRRVTLSAAPGPPGAATPLTLPRVARLADLRTDTTSGWTAWLLQDRYGLGTHVLDGTAIAAGGLSDYDALVVGDGATSPAELSPGALAALRAWVTAGGTLVGWRGRGVAVARAAGVTAVTAADPPASLQIGGVSLRVTLDSTDPVAWGEDASGFAFDNGDQLLSAHGAPVVARFPAGASFYVAGYASGTTALEGVPAATDERVGSGRVILFSFDPVFRGYVEGTERLVGNALLAPAGGATRRRAPGPVDPSALAVAPAPYRDATIRVDAADEAALLAAARAAGLTTGFTLDHDLTTVTLRVPNPDGLDPEQRPWTRLLPAALQAAGVTVGLALF